MSTNAPWLPIAHGYLGLAETPGKETTPTIRRWLIGLKAWWTDDETPWCGVFVGQCMREAGVDLPEHWYRARGWLDWGQSLIIPVRGCVVVFNGGPTRPGAGHVAFAAAIGDGGRILALGGNQGNRVSLAWFDPARVLGFRWPRGYPVPAGALSLVASDGTPLSQSEA